MNQLVSRLMNSKVGKRIAIKKGIKGKWTWNLAQTVCRNHHKLRKTEKTDWTSTRATFIKMSPFLPILFCTITSPISPNIISWKNKKPSPGNTLTTWTTCKSQSLSISTLLKNYSKRITNEPNIKNPNTKRIPRQINIPLMIFLPLRKSKKILMISKVIRKMPLSFPSTSTWLLNPTPSITLPQSAGDTNNLL